MEWKKEICDVKLKQHIISSNGPNIYKTLINIIYLHMQNFESYNSAGIHTIYAAKNMLTQELCRFHLQNVGYDVKLYWCEFK